MPCDYAIDAERQRVWSRAWGDVTDADLLDHQRRLAQDPTFHRHFSQLIDFRAARSLQAVTPAGIRIAAKRHLFGQHSRRAIVTMDPLTFGLARMFQAYREIARGEEEIHVFRNMDDALVWLGSLTEGEVNE
jgi:hypothetical protein